MKYTLMLGLGGVDEYLSMAKAADQAGWDCIGLPDSIFFPKFNESDYPMRIRKWSVTLWKAYQLLIRLLPWR